MSDKPKLENYYNILLRDILLNTLEQNKIVKSCLLRKDYDTALNELESVNEKLEELSKIFSLLEVIKTEFLENSEKDKIYN